MSRENPDLKELRILDIMRLAQQSGRRQGNLESKFLQKILDFFNFNVCLARRDSKSQQRLKLLMNMIPSFSELSQVFKEYVLENNVSLIK
jgi:hypothetical protein